MDLDHLSHAGIDATDAVGGDPFATAAPVAPGTRARALAGLAGPARGGVQYDWVFTTISCPSA